MDRPYTHYRLWQNTPKGWRPACQKHPGHPIPRLDDPSTLTAEEVTCCLCLHSEAMIGFRDRFWWKERTGE